MQTLIAAWTYGILFGLNLGFAVGLGPENGGAINVGVAGCIALVAILTTFGREGS